MKKILLPNGLSVSEVALGAMMFGTTVSKRDAYECLDLFLEMGFTIVEPTVFPSMETPQE